VPFVAQSGGHAWADWFRLGSEGIVINLRALNGVVVDADRGVAVIQGGATVGEVMNAAGAAGVHVSALAPPPDAEEAPGGRG